MKTNVIHLAGTVAEDVRLDHINSYDEKIYSFKISTKRMSGESDTFKVMVPMALYKVYKYDLEKGNKIGVTGQIRSKESVREDGKNKLSVYVFAEGLCEYESISETGYDVNEAHILKGYVCRNPIYRITPMGRQITDLLLATHRYPEWARSNRSEYIPCIAWGRNAIATSRLTIGSEVNIDGRFQSRDYTKLLSDGSLEVRTAYELSINKINDMILNDDNRQSSKVRVIRQDDGDIYELKGHRNMLNIPYDPDSDIDEPDNDFSV